MIKSNEKKGSFPLIAEPEFTSLLIGRLAVSTISGKEP